MTLVSTPAILLRAFPYSESSTILKFYARDLGVTGVMARGVRSRQSRGQAPLDTFAEGLLTIYVKESRDLQTFKDFAATKLRRSLAADVTRFAAASVLGELVLRHAGAEGNAPLYGCLAGALDRMTVGERGDPVAEFLAEAWALVDSLGYRPELTGCTACGRPMEPQEMGRFDFAAGGVRCADCDEGRTGPRIGGGARAQLTDLLDGRVPDPLHRPRAQVKLLNDFVTYHVSDGRPLQSFAFFSDLIRRTHA